MPNTILKGYPDVFGKHKVSVCDRSGPASYVTGGETLAPSSAYGGVNAFGTSSLDMIISGVSAGGYWCQFAPGGTGLRSTGKLIWKTSAGAEVTAATNLSGQTVRLWVLGK